MKQSSELETQAALQVAALMAAAARTAPKTRGIDNIRIVSIEDEPTKKTLLAKMREIAQAERRPSFERDAGCIAASPVILVIGVATNPSGLNCSFCGQEACQALTDMNGVCSFNSIDLGIACSSAAAVAADMRMDNRIMFSIGHACIALKIFGPEVKQALGIPISITGKSPFFDRAK